MSSYFPAIQLSLFKVPFQGAAKGLIISRVVTFDSKKQLSQCTKPGNYWYLILRISGENLSGDIKDELLNENNEAVMQVSDISGNVLFLISNVVPLDQVWQ